MSLDPHEAELRTQRDCLLAAAKFALRCAEGKERDYAGILEIKLRRAIEMVEIIDEILENNSGASHEPS